METGDFRTGGDRGLLQGLERALLRALGEGLERWLLRGLDRVLFLALLPVLEAELKSRLAVIGVLRPAG